MAATNERQDMQQELHGLMALPYETEWVEFKEAKNNYDFDDLGRYFSALSNAANLNGQLGGWLIFGVTNSHPRQVVGSSYRYEQPGLEKLKQEIARHTNHQMTFSAIHEVIMDGKRVVLFEIPPASRGIPTAWDGIAYGRIHDSIKPLTLEKIERIRRQATYEDWSAQACPGATENDLDAEAIMFARNQYKKKNPSWAHEVDRWDAPTFLNKTRVRLSGQLTRAAIILFGLPDATHLLSPANARVSWILKDEKGKEKDYEHFGPPLILAVDKVFAKIRNNTYRYLPNSTLFPVEITQYDPWVIREVLHNCIAHQDYTKGGHINVVEEPESLLFTNLGDFLPGAKKKLHYKPHSGYAPQRHDSASGGQAG